MRPFAVVLLFAVISTLAYGADKDEDKAKEMVAVFIKALKAKDIDAVMKTVDVPFFMRDKESKLIEKTEDVKTTLKGLLAELKDPAMIPSEIVSVHDLPALRKLVMDKSKDNKDKDSDKVKKELELLEKALGEKGYAVVIGRDGKPHGGVLIRIKGGTAKVVGLID
jgi:hypothetical protein